MKLVQFLDSAGNFDYIRYRDEQIKGNHAKIENNWTYKPTIKLLSEYIVTKLGVPKFGICHGTRRGNEQLWFKEFLGHDALVLGTEISDTATQFPHTIQHDFHEPYDEWIEKADFVYSNSWDHAYDPAKAFRVWVDSLRAGGLLLLEHSMGHLPEYAGDMDPFGASFSELKDFINVSGRGHFRVVDTIEAFPFEIPAYMGHLKFAVVGKVAKVAGAESRVSFKEPDTTVKKWFFTLSESSIERQDHGWRGLIRVAVQSALKHTNLQPNLIYDGKPNRFTDELQDYGVNIIYHRVSFYNALVEKDKGQPGYLPICSGVFLRVELPLIEREDDYVLYTDCDVMFTSKFNLNGVLPKTFASAPQTSKTDYRNDINTGVMVMNLPAMRAELDEFTQFIVAHLNDGWPGCDQENYRRFYKGRWDNLDLGLNWKPYWGWNPDAGIVHWHGPKPVLIRKLLQNPDIKTYEAWRQLFTRAPESYHKWLTEWDRNAANTNQTVVGHLDRLDCRGAAGWALFADDPARIITFNIEIDGAVIGRGRCNGQRPDLLSGYGTALGGFSFELPGSFRDGKAHEVRLLSKTGIPYPLYWAGSLTEVFQFTERQLEDSLPETETIPRIV